MSCRKCLLSAGLLLAACFTLSVAAQLPYKGYTYNQWGEALLSPEGYVPDRFINYTDMGLEDPLYMPQDMFYHKETKCLYIADTDNSRIVVLNHDYQVVKIIDSLNYDGDIESFSSPYGVYVDTDGAIYVADTKNERIVKCDLEGNVLGLFGPPSSPALESEDFRYQPRKLVVDKDGYIYVQAQHVYQGILCFDRDGNFVQFFGSNRVDVTAELLFEQMLRVFMTREQRSKMLTFVPMEYSNLYLSQKGFIYAVTSKTQNSLNEIKKINTNGDNVLRVNSYRNTASYKKNNYGDYPIYYSNEGQVIDTSFIDLHYDEMGYITALDETRGRVFVYDDESNLMFIFGGLGEQLGTFSRPTAVEKIDNDILVLDREEGAITIFRQTDFGRTVFEAIQLYNEGKYLEAMEPWQMVLQQNSNFNVAYNGLGKAYMQMEQYNMAMHYFKLGYDKIGYSDARQELFALWARENFGIIIIAILIFILIPFVVPWLLSRRKKRKGVYDSF